MSAKSEFRLPIVVLISDSEEHSKHSTIWDIQYEDAARPIG